jgi:hypothetical protein
MALLPHSVRASYLPNETQQFTLYHPMALLPHSDTAPFLPHIRTTGLHLVSSPSTACISTWTRPFPVAVLPIGSVYFRAKTFSHKNTPTFSSRFFFLLTPPMKMENRECSETSEYKIQTPGNHPKERIQYSEQGEIFKSNVRYTCLFQQLAVKTRK